MARGGLYEISIDGTMIGQARVRGWGSHPGARWIEGLGPLTSVVRDAVTAGRDVILHDAPEYRGVTTRLVRLTGGRLVSRHPLEVVGS